MAGIVGVHGIWNYLDGKSTAEAESHLSKVWTEHLAKSLIGLAPVPVTAAYYSPHLRRGRAQGPPDPDTLDAEERRWLELWDLALTPRPAEIAQGPLTRPPRQIINGMADRGALDSKAVGIFVTIFLKELKMYFNPADAGPRKAARDAVYETIRRTAPRIVIAHSMGSVVAYETLWEHPELEVDLLLTVGSPLGLPSLVFPKLQPAPADGRGSRPPGVRHWVNLADPGDLCAIPIRLGTRFDGIELDKEAPIGVFGFHKVARYLACPALGEIVRPYL